VLPLAELQKLYPNAADREEATRLDWFGSGRIRDYAGIGRDGTSVYAHRLMSIKSRKVSRRYHEFACNPGWDHTYTAAQNAPESLPAAIGRVFMLLGCSRSDKRGSRYVLSDGNRGSLAPVAGAAASLHQRTFRMRLPCVSCAGVARRHYNADDLSVTGKGRGDRDQLTLSSDADLEAAGAAPTSH